MKQFEVTVSLDTPDNMSEESVWGLLNVVLRRSPSVGTLNPGVIAVLEHKK